MTQQQSFLSDTTRFSPGWKGQFPDGPVSFTGRHQIRTTGLVFSLWTGSSNGLALEFLDEVWYSKAGFSRLDDSRQVFSLPSPGARLDGGIPVSGTVQFVYTVTDFVEEGSPAPLMAGLTSSVCTAVWLRSKIDHGYLVIYRETRPVLYAHFNVVESGALPSLKGSKAAQITSVCKECGRTSPNIFGGSAVAFYCPHCADRMIGSRKKPGQTTPYTPEIGQPFTVPEGRYQVGGFAAFQDTKWNYEWREYYLYSHELGLAILSEHDGHWVFSRPAPGRYSHGTESRSVLYNGKHFKKYSAGSYKLKTAGGCFPYALSRGTPLPKLVEYVAGADVLSLDLSKAEFSWMAGSHLDRTAVATGFGVDPDTLPAQIGTGYLQPAFSSFSFRALGLVTVAFCLMLILLQAFFDARLSRKLLYSGTFQDDALASGQVISSDPFLVTGPVQPLVLNISSDLINSWLFCEFSLIHQESGTTYYFSEELEFYSDNEGSEGRKKAELILNSIKPGTYQISVRPEYGRSSIRFNVEVMQGRMPSNNLLLALGLILAYPACLVYYWHTHETRKWQESEFGSQA